MPKHLPLTCVLLCVLVVGLLLHNVYHRSVKQSLFANSVKEHQGLPREAGKAHPVCEIRNFGQVTNFDATPLFKRLLPVEVRGACLFNPAILHYKEDLYLWFTWPYQGRGSDRCRGPTSPPEGAWVHGWDNEQTSYFLIAALLQHDLRTGRPLRVAYFKHSGIGDPHLWEYMKIDARLFRDQFGKIMLAHGSVWTPGLGFTPIQMSVSELVIEESSQGRFSAHQGNSTILPYLNISGPEKNWVPWNGTSLMTYPHHKKFEPHSVFDWGNYSHPFPHPAFYTRTPIPFVAAFKSVFGDSFHLSGGTPAILDNGSWLAAGHMLVPAIECHSTVPVMSNGTRRKAARMSASGHIVENLEGQLGYGHYRSDYFTFFYRFEAAPPYRFTFVSDAFKLPRAPPELGPQLGVRLPNGIGADRPEEVLTLLWGGRLAYETSCFETTPIAFSYEARIFLVGH